MWRAPRSPTPDSFLPSPRKKVVKRNPDALSPLVVGCRFKADNIENSNIGGVEPAKLAGADERESLLSDVQEEEETAASSAAAASSSIAIDDVYSDGYGRLSLRRRSNSMSLPDLRSRVCLVAGGSSPCTPSSSSCTPSSLSSDETGLRYERRVTQHTLDELSLPQLSEEEEEDDDDEDDREEEAVRVDEIKYPGRQKNNSLSLPDLTRVHPSRHVTVVKKANGTYVTAAGRRGRMVNGRDDDSAINDELFNDINGIVPRLPQLNITYQLCLSQPVGGREVRSGFQGNISVLRTGKPTQNGTGSGGGSGGIRTGKPTQNGIGSGGSGGSHSGGGERGGTLTTDTVLKLTGSKVHSPADSPRSREQPY